MGCDNNGIGYANIKLYNMSNQNCMSMTRHCDKQTCSNTAPLSLRTVQVLTQQVINIQISDSANLKFNSSNKNKYNKKAEKYLIPKKTVC